MTMCDGRDGLLHNGCDISNIVTIVTDRHGLLRKFRGVCRGGLLKGLPLLSEGRKTAQRTASFDGEAVKSAFALLSQKVTKAI